MKRKDSIIGYFNASVLPRIALLTIAYLIYTAAVCFVHLHVHINLSAPTLPFISSLSLVVGFLLVFRTNTAYDRYWEGRRLWSNITTASRSIARLIWSCTGKPAENGGSSSRIMNVDPVLADLTQEALVLLIAFAEATKDSLRKEVKEVKENSFGRWKKLEMSEHSSEENQQHASTKTQNVNVEEEGKVQNNVTIDVSNDEAKLQNLKRRNTNAISFQDIETPPLAVLVMLGRVVQAMRTLKFIDPAQGGQLEGNMNVLTDSLSGCQRIVRTPIPKAYSIHLEQILVIFCMQFPFTVVGTFGYYSILISGIVFFVFAGVYAIGLEIENPFGEDYNDLPLERFVAVIRNDIQVIQEH